MTLRLSDPVWNDFTFIWSCVKWLYAYLILCEMTLRLSDPVCNDFTLIWSCAKFYNLLVCVSIFVSRISGQWRVDAMNPGPISHAEILCYLPYLLDSKAAMARLSSSILALILSISSSVTNFGPWKSKVNCKKGPNFFSCKRTVKKNI